MSEARSLLERIGGFLKEIPCEFKDGEEENCLVGTFAGHHGAYGVVLAAAEPPLRLQIYVLLLTFVPPHRRAEMLEAVNRANCGFDTGSFEMGTADAKLWFRSTLLITDGELTSEQFRYAFVDACHKADEYNRAFCRLLYCDDLTPSMAIDEVEMGLQHA